MWTMVFYNNFMSSWMQWGPVQEQRIVTKQDFVSQPFTLDYIRPCFIFAPYALSRLRANLRLRIQNIF